MDADAARRHLDSEAERLARVRLGLENEHLHDQSEEESSGELSHMDQHAAEAASDAFEREKDFSILEQVEAELADVERALRRLDNGSYGTCEACGVAIGDERLAEQPATRFCIEHQVAAERI
ncbi:MAG: TraR/DksA C4-type zinc finger protein [Acidimicrobiales bacterium]